MPLRCALVHSKQTHFQLHKPKVSCLWAVMGSGKHYEWLAVPHALARGYHTITVEAATLSRINELLTSYLGWRDGKTARSVSTSCWHSHASPVSRNCLAYISSGLSVPHPSARHSLLRRCRQRQVALGASQTGRHYRIIYPSLAFLVRAFPN